MKSILSVADVRGWAVDNCTRAMIEHMPEYDWNKIYWTETYQEEMQGLARSTDIVYLANHDYGPHFPEAFRNPKIPIVVSVRSFRFDDAAVEFIRDRASMVVCCNRELERIFTEHSNTCRFIPDGIGGHFKPVDRPIVGFVGRRNAYKGLPLVREACSKLNYVLSIADREYAEMPEFYASVSCVVVASENEGMNTVPFEAMACNCPVITTDVGVARELDCIKIERSVEGITSGLAKLFGRSQVWPEYSWQNVCTQWREVFESL